jgi:hypothetical protein
MVNQKLPDDLINVTTSQELIAYYSKYVLLGINELHSGSVKTQKSNSQPGKTSWLKVLCCKSSPTYSHI